MTETGDVKKRVRQAIDQARRDAAARRRSADLASQQYGEFLEGRAAPVFHQVAGALRAEGYPFQVFTPAGSIRLASDRSGEDFIELELDTTRDPVALLGRTSCARGRRVVLRERVVHEGPDLDRLGADDVLAFLLAEIVPFVER
jgi:hypothetical protein